MRRVVALAWWAMCLFCAVLQPAQAVTLDRSKLQQYFPPPLIVGEKDPELPVWPLFRQDRTERGWGDAALVGYAFESIDFAPIPGFAGIPINLLIALDPQGKFMDVRVLSQREPVFVEGLGPEPLDKFVEQYPGRSLMQNIKIGSNLNKGSLSDSANVFIDGVSKATASVCIVNQSLLSAALQVARAKLGFSAGQDPALVGHIHMQAYTPMADWAALAQAGLVTRKAWANQDIEAAFRDTVGERQDPEALQAPHDLFTELMVLHLNVPSVGRNLLSPADWSRLLEWVGPGDHAFLVASRGRYSFVGDNYISGAVPDRLTLSQGGLPIELRDLSVDIAPRLPPEWSATSHPDVQWKILKVISQSGLDPSQPLNFALSVTRTKGQVLKESASQTFALPVQLPAAYVLQPAGNSKTWHTLWMDRIGEIAVLVVALGVLTALLLRPAWLVASARRLRWVRHAYLAFTLGFVGWFAQGQLSIVNITSFVQALVAGRSLAFFLFDPITVILWTYLIITFVLWGRGTFCGWLCPFGVLQEWVDVAARAIRLPRWRLHTRTDARLKALKYVVLAAIVASVWVAPGMTDAAVEVEPFKTAITLMFVRSWPYLLWAVGLLALSAFVYKGYCRYLCPLGAGMAILGRLRWLNWLPRRAECGQPCQTCRHRCQYQAIRSDGSIHYTECFQCMDCVAILADPATCTPTVLAQRKGRVIAVRAVPATPSGTSGNQPPI